MGRLIGDRPLTATERQRRWRAKQVKPVGPVKKRRRKRKPLTPTERQRRWRARKRGVSIEPRDKAARRPTPLRTGELDFWPTPPELRTALVRYVLPLLPEAPVWECAAGDGALVDALISAGRRVVATDIAPQRPDIARLDFLRHAPPAEACGAVAVTNPPFNQMDEFIGRALELLDSGHLSAVVLLLRGDHAAAQGRGGHLNRAVHEVMVTARTTWIPGSTESPRWWFHWVVWLADRTGPPVVRRVNRADLT
jgi:hypothetical protein